MHITEIQTTLCNFTRQWDNGSSSMLSKPDPKYWTVLLLQRKEPKWAAAFLKGSIHIICLFWQGAERRDRWCRAALCCLLEAFKKTLESNGNRSNTKLKHWFYCTPSNFRWVSSDTKRSDTCWYCLHGLDTNNCNPRHFCIYQWPHLRWHIRIYKKWVCCYLVISLLLVFAWFALVSLLLLCYSYMFQVISYILF